MEGHCSRAGIKRCEKILGRYEKAGPIVQSVYCVMGEESSRDLNIQRYNILRYSAKNVLMD